MTPSGAQARPRRLSDNPLSYVAGGLAEWIEDKGVFPTLGCPTALADPWQDRSPHQTLKDWMQLENYYPPGVREAQMAAFVKPLEDCTIKRRMVGDPPVGDTRVFSMGDEPQETRGQLRVLQHAEASDDVGQTCRHFEIGSAGFYRWRHALRM